MRGFFLCVCVMAGTVMGTVYQVNDAAIAPNARVELPAGDTAVLNGIVVVDSGATLIINPGCLVWGKPGSALVVARHGKLVANGTRQRPIVFTATADSMKKTPLTGIPPYSGLWGGIAILGNAKVNAAGSAKIYKAVGETDPRASYGGNNDSDSSGVLRYVSIRYAGTNEHCKENGYEALDAQNDQYDLAGLTLAGVGNRTQIEYVDVFKPLDDGFRFLGGSVRCSYLVSALPMASCFDFAEGFNGSCQFLAAFLVDQRLYEHRQFEKQEPIRVEGSFDGAAPAILANLLTTADNFRLNAVFLNDGAAIQIYNGLFDNAKAIYDFEMTCWPQFQKAKSKVANCVFIEPTQEAPPQWGSCANNDSLMWHLIENNNDLYLPMMLPTPSFFKALGGQQLRAPLGTLDPRPKDTLAITNVHKLDSLLRRKYGLQSVDFRGAFDPCDSTLWIHDWTGLEHEGYLARKSAPMSTCNKTIISVNQRQEPAFPLVWEVTSRSICCVLPQSGPVEIAVFGLDGRCLSVATHAALAAGTHRFSLDRAGVGVRLVRLTASRSVQTVRIVVK